MTNNFIKYPGGKYYLCPKILPLIPVHDNYCEPFLGGGTILLNKKPVKNEVCIDLDNSLISLWLYLKGGNLEKEVKDVVYCEDSFEKAKLGKYSPPLCEYILRRMSRGGLKKHFAWSNRLRGGRPGEINAWENAKSRLPLLKDRVKNVHFECTNSLSFLSSYKGFSYVDPPYLLSTRMNGLYTCEMTDEDHIQLCSTLTPPFILSGYDNPIYREILGPPTLVFDMPNHSSQTKTKERRKECLWISK